MLSERKGRYTLNCNVPVGPDSPLSFEMAIYEDKKCVGYQYASISSDKSDFVDQVIRMIKLARIFEQYDETHMGIALVSFNESCPEIKG